MQFDCAKLIASMGLRGESGKAECLQLIIYKPIVKMHLCLGWTLNNTWSATTAGAGNHYNVNLNNGNVNSNNDSNNNYVSRKGVRSCNQALMM